MAERLDMPASPPAPSGAGGSRADPVLVSSSGNGATPVSGERPSVISWAARARREAGPIGWAAFLACSWTWCIGMFLPVLMVRDYGGWGWTVFAVPNVIGAAAMGWVLRDRHVSHAVQQAHLGACRWFSLVTLAFHAFFAISLIPALIGDSFLVMALAMLPLVAALWGARGKRATIAASLVLAVSVLAMLSFVALRGLTSIPSGLPGKSKTDLLWLGAVSAFGFMLAPYLDITFHRARQSTTRAGGRTAFGVGFGVFFLLMIVFTALYAEPLIGALDGTARLSLRTDLAVAVLAVHLAIQTAFTVVAHTEAVRDTRSSPTGAGGWWRVLLGAALIVALAIGLRWVAREFPTYRGLRQSLPSLELIYRVFMAFYGLVFPAYVWLFMFPSLRHRRPIAARPPRPATIIFFAAVVTIAAPMFWMGFIEGRMLWLVPGLVLVMVSRLLLPKGAPAGVGAVGEVPGT